jgi:hypothetical protein
MLYIHLFLPIFYFNALRPRDLFRSHEITPCPLTIPFPYPSAILDFTQLTFHSSYPRASYIHKPLLSCIPFLISHSPQVLTTRKSFPTSTTLQTLTTDIHTTATMPCHHTRAPYSIHTGMTTSYFSPQDGEFHYPNANGVEHFDRHGHGIRPEDEPNARDAPVGFVDRRGLVQLHPIHGIRGPPGAGYAPVVPTGMGHLEMGFTPAGVPAGMYGGPAWWDGIRRAPIDRPAGMYGAQAPRYPPAYPHRAFRQPSPIGGEGEMGLRFGPAAGPGAGPRIGGTGYGAGGRYPPNFQYVGTDPTFGGPAAASGAGPRQAAGSPYAGTYPPFTAESAGGYYQNPYIAYAATHRQPLGVGRRTRRGGVQAMYFIPAIHTLGGGPGPIVGRGPRAPDVNGIGPVGSVPQMSVGPLIGGYAGGDAAMAGRGAGDGAQQGGDRGRCPDCTCDRGGPTTWVGD